MSISEQVKDIDIEKINDEIKLLRTLSCKYNAEWKEEAAWTFAHAADTIESLSAKLADMERPAEYCSGGWIMANVKNENYICDYRLKDYYGVILITYETLKKKRYVKAVLCNYGHINKKIGGEIIAWQFLPDSCKEKNPYK